jgi:hypothetical protein
VTEYFAIDCQVPDLLDRVDKYYEGLWELGWTQKLQLSHFYYYGKGDKSAFIRNAGAQKQTKELMVNDYGSLVEHVLTLVTAERPSFDVRTTNSDYKSMAQAVLGEQILEYYLRENKVEKLLKRQCDYALKYSEGFIGLDWDTSLGQFIGQQEDGRPLMGGDIRYGLYHPLQVVRDIRNTGTQDWVILVLSMNKYELAAKFTNQAQEIIKLDSAKYDDQKRSLDYLVGNRWDQETDMVPVYLFMHRKGMALPEGKICMFVDGVKLTEGPLPYDEIPLSRMAPKDYDETCLGFTPMWNLLSLQDASDRLYSAVLSNNLTFAKQVLQTTAENDITPSDLAEGIVLLETDAKIEAVQLTRSAPETYNLIEILKGKMQEQSGANEVIRGTPGPNLRSGNALVVVAAQALTYNSGIEHSYNMAVEEVGTLTLRFLKQFAEHPRFATIVGKYKQAYLKEFKATDLTNVDRVTVQRRNPIMSTAAGRLQIAENLLTNQMITSADQYLMVMETGSLDPMTEPAMVELMLIKNENEWMAEGKAPIAVPTDNHAQHIMHHKAVLANIEARFEPDVVKSTLDHIQMHIDLMRTLDPEFLTLTGNVPSSNNQGGQPPVQSSAEVQQSATMTQPQKETDLPALPEEADAITQSSYDKFAAISNPQM